MQTRKALKRLSKGQVEYRDRVTGGGPLADNASWLLERHAQREQQVQSERDRHEFAQSMPVLEAARNKLAQIIGDNILPDDTPVATRFDVFNTIKQASKDNPKDTGLKMFATHLERLWHKEPLGTITAGALSQLRDHYQTQHPRSVVGEITDTTVPKVAFNNLPVAKLSRIASEIGSQEDYNIAIVRNGLHRDDLRSIRARAFIRELVNRKLATEEELKDNTASTGIAKRSSAGDVGKRVASRILREGQTLDTSYENKDYDDEQTSAEDAGMGTDGSGMLYNATAAKKEWNELMNHLAATGEGLPKVAVAPPGWEETVKDMKGEEDIDNPYALAWWMEGKGYEPGGSDKDSNDMPTLQSPDEKEGQGTAPMPAPIQPPTVTASKQAADSEGCFDPDVNDQQPDQVTVPDDGGSALKGKSQKKATILNDFAVKANHPLVDDNKDHFPSFDLKQSELVLKTASNLDKSPSWWLGSVDELMETVNNSYLAKDAELNKQSGDLPPEFKENMKDKKDKGEKPLDKKESRFDPNQIESNLLGGDEFRVGKYALNILTNNGSEVVELSTKKGSRKYALSDIEDAIADFMYLAKNETVRTSPNPMFMVREGFMLICPACDETNSYPMPKEAADLNCDNCSTILPSRVVKSAFKSGTAEPEVTLIAFTPLSLQNDFGDKFAKAAENLGANSIGALGPRAEASAIRPSDKKLASIWDFMVNAGFKPLAQYYSQEDMPPMNLDEDPLLDMPEMDNLEMGDDPMLDPSDVPDLGEPSGGADWADHQMTQAAMMHYKAQGDSVTEAVTQFTKDYGDGYDPEMVMQVASQVYGIGLDQVKIGMSRKADDLPSTNVNQQQNDYVNVSKSTMAEEGDLNTPSVNQQVPGTSQQGTSTSDTSMSTKNTDLPSPGKPKAEHPPTKQPGVSLPSTDGPGAGLGPGEHSDNPPSKSIDKAFTQ